jgi:hypothetical protein
MTDERRAFELRRCLMGIIACFRSRVNGCDDVGCINDHHPSCLTYAESVLARVDKETEDADIQGDEGQEAG